MFHIHSIPARLAGSVICLAALILFIAPITVGIKNIGNIFGIAISFFFFIFFTFNESVSKFTAGLWQNKAGKVSVIAVVTFLAVGFALASVISVFMIKSAYFNKNDISRPAIVLGCKVNGTKPSAMLQRRLKAAVEYLNEFPDAKIIVSGGQGDNEDISEAECMKKYLTDKGYDPDRIIKEDKSENTYQNIEFSKRYLEANNLGNDVAIITDSFHQMRASIIAGKLDLEVSGVSSTTPFYVIPTYWVREWFGIVSCIKYLF